MATTTPRPPEHLTATDPYFYGWRCVEERDERGRRQRRTVPLTETDVLHPQEEDHVTQDDVHAAVCHYLVSVAKAQFPPDRPVLVLQDVLIIWDTPDRQRRSPDVAVVPGLRRDRRRPSFDVAKEGVRPLVIFEVTSEAMARVDRSIKRRQYAQRGVA